MLRVPLPERRLTYQEVGATRGELPEGYEHIVAQTLIGRGEQRYRDAVECLMSWGVHRAAGLRVGATTERVQTGSRALLTWGRFLRVTAACEVVYVFDEPRLSGFAYGTLEGHPEQGEERFDLQWRDDDAVLMTITAFSRPATWWARLAAPVSRRVQRRITRRYLQAL
jgi:uncharacterized protein (UPF0548 family)